MAADSQATYNNSLMFEVTKIFKTDNYILAFSGSLDDGYQYKAILDDEMKIKDANISKDFNALVWYPDGRVEEIFSSLFPVPFTGKFTAIGSGMPYAMAVMACGKTAREAVEIAKKLDCGTGGKIISYSWDKITRRKGKKKKNADKPEERPEEVLCLPTSTSGN